ncbi:hydroxyquinol 1,2-dioxygenase, putative [Talaromyces stipitatus ATCC 10500]|uniref:Hydroxyquinol 1,2-dioxygenase, putative n=1 Tax=Talaromyces stipitatus (strain ATCC 10500 / CBS 375.48 / QM 6759 / NRRL 1006) TaxID=441959 RepID=B8MLZ2_TALSN|nr:hydroxyquinol 1,2-dioxygenase, putative [Talaromyces stipitatus ATCC 10500]EED13504.1 hydroxyquinol 1,2-dioxygenase, putative [Talaromyces stipitatus ATCC 10500]
MHASELHPLTISVLSSFGSESSPRAREILAGLVRYLHAFCRDVNLTTEELHIAIEVLNRSGQMSNPERNETLLIADCLGVEAFVDAQTQKALEKDNGKTTNSCVLGPFYTADPPRYLNGDSIIQKYLGGEVTFFHGRILDADTNLPIAGASLNVWQCAVNGLYDQQDPSQPSGNMRGMFTSDGDGNYAFYCIKPIPYPVPYDGPAGDILKLMDRHPYRAAHIHFMVTSDSHHRLNTQVFPEDDSYLDSDSVYAVKSDLLLQFKPYRSDLPQGKGSEGTYVKWEVNWDFKIKRQNS